MFKIIVPLAEGYEEVEAITIIDILRRAGAMVTVAGLQTEAVTGSHGITIQTDTLFNDVADGSFDAIILPGGMPGARHLNDDPRIIRLLQRMALEERLIGAICAAPMVLHTAGLLAGKSFTMHPSVAHLVDLPRTDQAVVIDGRIITGRSAGAAMEFALAIVNLLYGESKTNELNRSIIYPLAG